jgi:hypothetical protein
MIHGVGTLSEGVEMSRTKRGSIRRSPAARAIAPPETRSAVPDLTIPRRVWSIVTAVLLVASFAAVGAFAMIKLWSQPEAKQVGDGEPDLQNPNQDSPADPPEPKKKPDEFAADRPGAVKPAPFDAKRAMGYLEALCKIGPRMSGTDGMKKQQEMLEKHFTDLGGKVAYQRFNTGKQTHLRQQNVDMANMIVSWNPERARRVILCSHYDTRPHADEERNERLRLQPFISANDGGSGVALLMELAHHMKGLETAVGVDFVFFDGEEYVWDRDDEYFFGSKHFGSEYRKNRGKMQYTGAVLLDMVGGKNIKFPIEQNSWWRAEKLVREVWGIAAELHCDAFRDSEFSKFEIQDDHLALNRNGIPAIDIIDFDYPHWHRVTDVPENCSGESLEQVARVLSVWLQRTR